MGLIAVQIFSNHLFLYCFFFTCFFKRDVIHLELCCIYLENEHQFLFQLLNKSKAFLFYCYPAMTSDRDKLNDSKENHGSSFSKTLKEVFFEAGLMQVSSYRNRGKAMLSHLLSCMRRGGYYGSQDLGSENHSSP